MKPFHVAASLVTGYSGEVAVVDNRLLAQISLLIDDPAARRETSAVEVAQRFGEAARAANPILNALIALTPEVAGADALRVDAARAAGSPLSLDGMPIVIKDNIDLAGWPTTAASRSSSPTPRSTDAEVVRRVREAGALVIGKANLHEIAYGATTVNPPPFGPTRNPWHPGRVAGGSSGGTAASVAADLSVAGLGTDTGGSVRIPAALTGVTGLRPTIGRVSTRGVLPLSKSLDTVGPMARNVGDVAQLYRAMAGYDPADPQSIEFADSPASHAVKGLRIGSVEGYFRANVAPGVTAAVDAALDAFADLGADVTPAMVDIDEAILDDVASVIRPEAFETHRLTYMADPTLFGPETRELLEIGKAVEGWRVAAAHRRGRELRQSLRQTFERFDLLVTATTRDTAPVIGDRSIETTWTLIAFTYPWSLAGVPVVSMPVGFDHHGLPVGCQLIAAWGQEELLLSVVSAYQQVTDWHRRRPPGPGSESVA
jgi:aspartyl-tRNA(Asn)/glutamyl-tRNA(Gln) amidotransferase subunit A